MTAAVGESVRTLLEVQSDSGSIISAGTRGTVIGFAGDDLVVEFRDEDRDETATATLHVWEVSRR